MNSILFWGLVPPVMLLAYTWRLDRVEKEPVDLVARVFFMGAVSTCAAVVLESLAGAALGAADLDEGSYLYLIIENFLAVALIEEICKRAPVTRLVWRNPAFDYRFDAIVYCLASALGFAAIENILYIWQEGTGIALMRLIPVHSICAIFMGHYLGMAKTAELDGHIGRRGKYMRLSLLIPVLIHGFWDFALSTDRAELYLAALLMIVILTILAFRSLHRYAREDRPV